MPFALADIDFRTTLPDIPKSAPVVTLTPPCPGERAQAIKGMAKALKFEPRGTVEVPHGFAVGSAGGQVEIFTASGAVRGRNTDQLSRYPDEQRKWADVRREDTRDGVVHVLGERAAKALTSTSLKLLDSVGLAGDHTSVTVTLGQWARLDMSGAEIASGPGRATVQFAYEAAGLPLIGAGAKTNLHYDPDERGERGTLARFFHVNRAAEGASDVRTLSLEQALQPLFTETWSGVKIDWRAVRVAVTSVKFGLLALPADVFQRYAAPALAVEGRLEGVAAADGREVELRFGQYLPLTHPKVLAAAGFASAGSLAPGMLVTGRDKGH